MLNARQLLSVTMLAASFSLTACGSPADTSVPPEIVYGEDVCAQCGMIISDPRYAAALWVAGERGPESRVFDDIGDLLAYEDEHRAETVLARYVHDFESEDWIDAETAVYIHGGDVQSPMGHGIAAFADADRAAEQAATDGATVVSFDELTAEPDHQSRTTPAP
jgi:copper chaperone NosL